MDLKSLDKLQQSKELVNGLQDIMIFMETAKQDVLIPIRVFYPFREVLNKVGLLLAEIEEKEREGCDSSQA